MFPDSKIAKSFHVARTKLHYVVSNGLALYFKQQLEGKVSGSYCFSISFNESLNNITHIMDILIRYWDNVDMEVKVRF